MKNDTTAFTFITLINNAPVHRVDLTKDSKKNTRDYAYGLAHYSVGSDFKAEVRYTDKTETTVAKVIIKNKTFNTIVAEYAGNTEAASALVHALDNRTMITRLVKTNGQKTQAELSKLARVM